MVLIYRCCLQLQLASIDIPASLIYCTCVADQQHMHVQYINDAGIWNTVAICIDNRAKPL